MTPHPARALLKQFPAPEVKHVVFERSPLVLAVCQLHFDRVLDISSPSVIAPFHAAIKRSYPVVENARETRIANQPELAIPDSSRPIWQVSDRARQWMVLLAEDSITLQTRAFEQVDNFSARLKPVLTALRDTIKPTAGTRVGLRYVDEVRPGHERWGAVISPPVLGPLALEPFRRATRFSVQEITLSFEDSQQIVMRHGLIPSGAVVRPTGDGAPPQTPFYLIDIDASHEPEPSKTISIDPELISEYVKSYNEALYRLFRWCLTDEYTQSLGVRRRG